VRLQTSIVLSNATSILFATNRVFATTIGPTQLMPWDGNKFKLPILTNLVLLPDSVFRSTEQRFVDVRDLRSVGFGNVFERGSQLVPDPRLRLAITNRLEAILVDLSVAGGRVVDYVNLDNLNSVIDVTSALFGQDDAAGQTSLIGSFWQTNRVGGIPEVSATRSRPPRQYQCRRMEQRRRQPIQGQDKERRSIDSANSSASPVSRCAVPTLRMQVRSRSRGSCFRTSPGRPTIPSSTTLLGSRGPGPHQRHPLRETGPRPVGPETHNLGQINHRYRPWQRGLYSSADATDFLVAVRIPRSRA
jgi:hypothetical protein